MALGKTVIATSAGGFPEIIENGVNGILCLPNDTKALCQAILNGLDRTDLKKIEQNAADRANQYEAAKIASQMLDLYGSL
jgi:glycosyltransferase involved in cell wall biosynthesis